MHKLKIKADLETRIFSRVCLIMATVAFMSLILDILFSPIFLFLAVDVAVVSALVAFFYLVNYKFSLKKLTYPFITFLIIMINISWSVSGQGMGVGYIYFFILILFLIITEGKQRILVTSLVVSNVIILTIIQAVNPDFGNYSLPSEGDENMATGIGLAALLTLTAYVIGYLKKSYETERKIVNQQNYELAEKNHEIEAQNEELRQYQDQIVTQRDEIERHVLELRDANQKVHEVNIDLESMVKERTSELDELFYRSSHDFRQPVTTLMGLSYLAKKVVSDHDSLELFSKVDSTCHKMDQMLEKFLMIYEINHFNVKDCESCGLGEILHDIQTNLIKDQSFVHLKVNKKIDKYSKKDPRNFLFKFILTCLIDNSIQFKKGKEVNINVDIGESNGNLKVAVSDDGLGIAKDQVNRIFDMFIRTNEVSTGSGMGLYVVKKAVEKLNGHVLCESEEGKYSKFEITFPIVG